MRLTYQSTGDEMCDRDLILGRLFQGKKASVIVDGCEEEVRFRLGALFGWDAVQGMRRIVYDDLTFSETWQCELRRDLSKDGDHSRERARAVQLEEEGLLVDDSAPEPQHDSASEGSLSAHKFIQELEAGASTVRLDAFDTRGFSERQIAQWRSRYAAVWEREGHYVNMKGMLAERIVPAVLRSHLNGLLTKVASVFAYDLRSALQSSPFTAFDGYGSGRQVCFMRSAGKELTGYLEVDALYQTPLAEEYIALDVTTAEHKSFRLDERTEKIAQISRALQRDMVLLDITLKDTSFSFQKLTDRMYRWNLPSTLDFSRLIEEIIPRPAGNVATLP